MNSIKFPNDFWVDNKMKVDVKTLLMFFALSLFSNLHYVKAQNWKDSLTNGISTINPILTVPNTQKDVYDGVDSTRLSLDSFYNKIGFDQYTFNIDMDYVRSKVHEVSWFENIFHLISTDSLIREELDLFLLKNYSPLWSDFTLTSKHIASFLYDSWVPVDWDGKTVWMNISWVAKVSIDSIIQSIPILGWLTINWPKDSITIYKVSWNSQNQWLSGMWWKIAIFEDITENESSTFLNEVTWDLFTLYVDQLKLKRPDLVDWSRVTINLWTFWSDAIRAVLGNNPSSNQWNEYWWDLINLYQHPAGHIEHMLTVPCIEAWIIRSFWYSNNPDNWWIVSAKYVNNYYQTYLLSKHSIGSFLLSEKFLSTIPYEEWTLRNYFTEALAAEAKNQYTNKNIDEPWYMPIRDVLTTAIIDNKSALLTIQGWSLNELEKLEGYLNSF